MDAQTVLLPSPGEFNIDDYKVAKVRCGFLAVELALIASYLSAGIKAQLSKRKILVAYHILTAMMPWHMMRSLEDKRLIPVLTVYGEPPDICAAIDHGSPVIIFLGVAVGHWVTMWGYDEESYYYYDNRVSVERDAATGLSSMSHEEFKKLWYHIPVVLRPFQWKWVTKLFPSFRLKPGTMITLF